MVFVILSLQINKFFNNYFFGLWLLERGWSWRGWHIKKHADFERMIFIFEKEISFIHEELNCFRNNSCFQESRDWKKSSTELTLLWEQASSFQLLNGVCIS